MGYISLNINKILDGDKNYMKQAVDINHKI